MLIFGGPCSLRPRDLDYSFGGGETSGYDLWRTRAAPGCQGFLLANLSAPAPGPRLVRWRRSAVNLRPRKAGEHGKNSASPLGPPVDHERRGGKGRLRPALAAVEPGSPQTGIASCYGPGSAAGQGKSSGPPGAPVRRPRGAAGRRWKSWRAAGPSQRAAPHSHFRRASRPPSCSGRHQARPPSCCLPGRVWLSPPRWRGSHWLMLPARGPPSTGATAPARLRRSGLPPTVATTSSAPTPTRSPVLTRSASCLRTRMGPRRL